MTGRDRMVLIGVVVLALLAAGWVLVVSPQRKQASKLDSQVAAARTQLSSAEGQLATARTAQSQYSTAYASVVSLGKAVPASEEVPSLIVQLSHASDQKSVQLTSIVATTAAAPASGAAAAAATGPASSFTQMPFTFVFEGGFFDLEHLFRQVSGFTTRTPAGTLLVSGRLLTIQSVKLAPVTTGAAAKTGAASDLSGTITATAYVLPASQGLTGSATSTSPTGSGATPASAAGAPSSPTAPAIVNVTP